MTAETSEQIASLERRLAALEEDNRRLRAGKFKPEEFQSLCHSTSPEDRCAFKRGCVEYWRTLFGVQEKRPGAVGAVVTITYTNSKGETSERSIAPQKVWFGRTEWHPEAQWLLDAWDLGKSAKRTFACNNIIDWRPE